MNFPSLLSLLESSITYFSSNVGSRARVLAFSLEKALKNPSAHAYLLLQCVCVRERERGVVRMACDSNLSCAIGMNVCRCVFPLLLRDQLFLACLTRYPVITSTLPLYFTIHAHSQHTHRHTAYTFGLFLTSLSSRGDEEAEIRSIGAHKVRRRGASKACDFMCYAFLGHGLGPQPAKFCFSFFKVQCQVGSVSWPDRRETHVDVCVCVCVFF